jgi:hypothetical protein
MGLILNQGVIVKYLLIMLLAGPAYGHKSKMCYVEVLPVQAVRNCMKSCQDHWGTKDDPNGSELIPCKSGCLTDNAETNFQTIPCKKALRWFNKL